MQCGQHFCFVLGFLEKNRDALSSDLIHLVETSSNKFLRKMFNKELDLSSNTIKSSSNPKMRITISKNASRVSVALEDLDLLHRVSYTNDLFLFCLAANTRQQEACADFDGPVPSVPGLADENTDSLSALFHPLHQT